MTTGIIITHGKLADEFLSTARSIFGEFTDCHPVTNLQKSPQILIKELEEIVASHGRDNPVIIFIDFWGSWCGPCLGEIPNIKKLYASVSKEKLKVIGLAYDDVNALAKCIEENKIEYPNAIAPDKTLKEYGITAYPTTLLIDPDGRIIAKNLRGSNLVAAVQEKMDSFNIRSFSEELIGYLTNFLNSLAFQTSFFPNLPQSRLFRRLIPLN